MRILMKIVFIIFIANGIDCLGEVCDNCCDCFKGKEKKEKQEEEEENEEINEDKEKKNEKIEGDKKDENKEKEKKDEKIEGEENEEEGNITAESLVNEDWNNFKDNPPVLKIFKKNSNIFISTGNEGIISFELEGKDNNFKIKIQDGKEDEFNLGDEKYTLFKIKTQKEETVYLYCSDVESSLEEDEDNNNYVYGIFEKTKHKSISVIACDTKKVKDMRSMFANCSSLTELNLQNFNTENVTDMKFMFYECSNLTELDLKNFNTTKVFHMNSMFYECSRLKKLDLKNFDTTNVTSMESMFNGCSNLTDLKCGENFKTEKVINKKKMFSKCSSFPENIRNDLNNVEEIIDFFKKNNPKKIL